MTPLFQKTETDSLSIPTWLVLLSVILSVFYILWEVNQFIQISSDEHTFWYTYNEAFLKLFSASDRFPQWNPYILSGVSLHDTTPFPLSLSSLGTLLLRDGVLGLLLSRILLLSTGAFFLLAWLRNFGLKPILTLPVLFLFFEYHLKHQSFESLPTLLAIVLTYASLLFVKKRKYYVIGFAAIFLGAVLNDYVSQGSVFVFPFQILLVFFLRHRIHWRPHLYSVILIWTLGLLMALPTMIPQIVDVQESQKLLCPDYVNATLSGHYIRDVFAYLFDAYGFVLSAGMIIPLLFAVGFPLVYWNDLDDFAKAFIKSVAVFILVLAVFYLSQGVLMSIPFLGHTLSAYNKIRPVQVAHFGLLLLLGISLQKCFAPSNLPSKIGRWGIFLAAVFILLFFIQNVNPFFMAIPRPPLSLVNILQLIIFVMAFALICARRRFVKLVLAAGFLLVFIVLWVHTGSRHYTQKFPPHFSLLPTFEQSHTTLFPNENPETALKLTEFLQNKTGGDFSETAELRGLHRGDGLPQNYSALQIPTIHGFTSIRSLRGHQFYLWVVDDLRINKPDVFNFLYQWGGFAFDYGSRYDTELLNLMGVKYLIADKTVSDDRFPVVMEGEKTRILENKNAFPRVFLANGAALFDSAEQVGDSLKGASSETLKNTVVLFKKDVERMKGGAAAIQTLSGETGKGSAAIVKFTPNDVWVEVQSERPSMLVLTQSYHRGWQVAINGGIPADVYPAYYAYLGAMIPKGKSLVKFAFSDKIFVKCAYLAQVVLGLLLLMIVMSIMGAPNRKKLIDRT